VKDEDDAYTNKMELEADLETQMRETSVSLLLSFPGE